MSRSLTHEEIQKVCHVVRQALQSGSKTERRDACGVLLGLSGLRIEEVCRLNRNDLSTDGDGQNWINVRTLKGGMRRRIPVEPNLAAQLRNLHQRLSAGPLLQCDHGGRLDQRHLRRSWHKLRETAGVAPARFHDLRHTCATAAWHQSGRNLFVVQTILGHRSLNNTRIYLTHTGDLQKAVISFAVPMHRSELKRGENDPT